MNGPITWHQLWHLWLLLFAGSYGWNCGRDAYYATTRIIAEWPDRIRMHMRWRRTRRNGSAGPPPPQHVNCRCVVKEEGE